MEFDMITSVTEQSFLKDVREHRMTVLHDTGLYRHLRFQKPGTRIGQFDIVTWPGHLSFTGDMGSYVFARLADMLEFFRDGRSGSIQVNLAYWAEKCQAADRDSGIKEYSAAKFREEIERWLDDGEATPECRAEARSSVLVFADEGEYAARSAAESFEYEGFEFTDFWEADCQEWTARYVWCCFALAWAVRQYDSGALQAA